MGCLEGQIGDKGRGLEGGQGDGWDKKGGCLEGIEKRGER